MSVVSSSDRFAEVFSGLRQSAEAGRLAHAYLVVAPPRGQGMALAESLLQLVFCRGEPRPCGGCAECRRVHDHAHPDIHWIEPESKSRRIEIDTIRDRLLVPMAQTAYGGGWKAGLLLNADRMTEPAANALLKMLEEPPANSLILLLTGLPSQILPTIRSRCQRLLLAVEDGRAEEKWHDPLRALLRADVPCRDAIAAMARAGAMKAILDAVHEEVESGLEEEEEADEDVVEARLRARVLEVRTRILRFILDWRRDVLLQVQPSGAGALQFPDEAEYIRRQAAGLDYGGALRRLRAVEALGRRLERHLPEETAFEALWLEDVG